MIDFIIKLEDALIMGGVEYEIRYIPEEKQYILNIDGAEAIIKEKNNDQT